MRHLLAAAVVVAALVLPSSASAAVLPIVQVAEDGGSAGTTCRWNPYWRIECALATCWWTGRFEWYDPYGNSTGIPCA